MIHAAIVVAYLGMLVFDAFILSASVWLIGWHGWSPWWMLFTCLLCAGSAPNLIFKKTVSTEK